MKIKILQVCAVDFTVKNFLKPLIRFLGDEGFDVTTVCSKGNYFPELETDGIKMVALPISRSMNILSHVRSIFLLYKYLKREKFHIIHVHTPIAALIGRVAGFLAGVPIRIYTAHGFYFHDEMPPLKKKIFVSLERFGHLFGDFIFTQSDEDRRSAIAEKICSENEIVTIGNGIDMKRFDPAKVSEETKMRLREEFGIVEGDKVVAIIGRIVREKGYFEFFQAAAEILKINRAVKFIVIGDALKSEHDISKQEIFDFVEKSGIKSSVIFAGMRSDIPEVLSIADVFTLPSHREGMPRSIIEAMAMGKPVVTSDIRGCREEVVDGETGYIIPLKDASALKEKIAELLESPEKARAFGENGRKRALLLYSEDIVLKKQLLIVKKLIEQKKISS